jgi:Zn-finger protein
MVNKEQMCPFCPLLGMLEGEVEPVGNRLSGEPAMIGNVASCESCAMIADATNGVEALLAELREVQAGQRCHDCQREGVHLYEVAGMQLCGDCIAPPRQ